MARKPHERIKWQMASFVGDAVDDVVWTEIWDQIEPAFTKQVNDELLRLIPISDISSVDAGIGEKVAKETGAED